MKKNDKNFLKVFNVIANGIVIGAFVGDMINTSKELAPTIVDKAKAKKAEKQQRTEERKIEEVTDKYFERVYMFDENGVTHYYYKIKEKETESTETTADTESTEREYKL